MVLSRQRAPAITVRPTAFRFLAGCGVAAYCSPVPERRRAAMECRRRAICGARRNPPLSPNRSATRHARVRVPLAGARGPGVPVPCWPAKLGRYRALLGATTGEASAMPPPGAATGIYTVTMHVL